MKTRTVTLPTGLRLRVPTCIQRIDHASTHGWQVRYHGARFYADGQQGARQALRAATAELADRARKYPAPVRLKHAPQVNKRSGLPNGITGPHVRQRERNYEASLMVLVPRFGRKPQRKSVYIGTENTYTAKRFRDALARAVEIRAAAEKEYRRAATIARRADHA